MAFHRDVRVHLSQLHVSLAALLSIPHPGFFPVGWLVFYQIRFNFDGIFYPSGVSNQNRMKRKEEKKKKEEMLEWKFIFASTKNVTACVGVCVCINNNDKISKLNFLLHTQ